MKRRKIIVYIALVLIIGIFVYRLKNNNQEFNDQTELELKNSNISESSDINYRQFIDNKNLGMMEIPPYLNNKDFDNNKVPPLKKIFPNKEANKLIPQIYKTEERVVYLTFDDGPSRQTTLALLDLLKKENIRASFFVLGYKAEKNPEIVRQAYNDGHYIANHGYSHIYSEIYKTPQAVYDEYLKTEKIFKDILGEDYNSYLFRFPGGSMGGKYHEVKQKAKKILEEKDVAWVDWSTLTGDSVGKNTVEKQVAHFRKHMNWGKGNVVLQHDLENRPYLVEVTKKMIDILRQEGYTFKNFYDL